MGVNGTKRDGQSSASVMTVLLIIIIYRKISPDNTQIQVGGMRDNSF